MTNPGFRAQRIVSMRTLYAAALTVGLALAVSPALPASAETMTSSFSSCKQLRAEYAGGIAKNAKSAKKIKRAGYRSPIVCPRVYKQVSAQLDPNRNGVACESR